MAPSEVGVMLKKMAIFLGVTPLPTLPVSVHQFLSQLPSITTKEEAESRGLILTFSNGGGGWEGSNYVNYYQAFICPHRNESLNNCPGKLWGLSPEGFGKGIRVVEIGKP